MHRIEHLETVELDHSEIHILSGLCHSLLDGDILSDTILPKQEIRTLLYKLEEAHEHIVLKEENSL